MNNVLISKESCKICYRNEEEKRPEYDEPTKNLFARNSKVYSHYGLFHQLLNYLQSLGYVVSKDPDIEKNYKILSKDRRYGIKGQLEFKAERYPTGFKIDFFQNVVYENPNGGYYDFNKFKKMPYLIRLSMISTMNKVFEWFKNKGIEIEEDIVYRHAVDKIKNDYVCQWTHEQTNMNFDLSDLNGKSSEIRNSKDRDGEILHNGDIKYFRDYDGYLCRGKIYYNIGNMWWVIINKFELRNIAAFNLFDASSEDFAVRRKKKKYLPKEHVEKRKIIDNMSNNELLSEIKRRKLVMR